MTYTLDPPLPSTSTPKDYHRVHFDPSTLPPQRIVGLLACQRDPLLRHLTTRVISAKPAQAAPPVSKGKSNKKKDAGNGASSSVVKGSSSSTPTGELWELELEDTVIFPEGGGQPFDTGTITFSEDGEDRTFVVQGCLRRKLHSVHLIRAQEGDESLLSSSEGKEAQVRVDWERRMDHMALHTSQHLLSAVLDTFAEGLPTLSWSLSAYPTSEAPYVELPRALTWDEADQVEKRCNDLIAENRNIWVDVDTQEEGFVKMTAAGVRESRGIPQDYENGVIRHINIDGIDRNACCGTQLPSLSHIGFIHVIPPSTLSTSSKPTKSPSKLYFVSGPRAVKYLKDASKTLSLASQALAVSRNDLPAKVAKNDEIKREVMSKEKDLRAELAKVIGESAARDPEAKGVYWISRSEKSTHDFDFLNAMAMSIISTQPSAGNLEGRLVVIVSAVPGLTPSLLMVNSPSADLAKKVNDKIKAALEEGEGKGRVKGGGARGRFMSKIDGKWGKAETDKLEAVINELRATSVI